MRVEGGGASDKHHPRVTPRSGTWWAHGTQGVSERVMTRGLRPWTDGRRSEETKGEARALRDQEGNTVCSGCMFRSDRTGWTLGTWEVRRDLGPRAGPRGRAV